MKTRRKRDEILRIVMEAVESILHEKGFSGLSVNQISLRAGVAKSTIYDHYQSRNGLLLAYIMKKDFWLPTFEKLKEEKKPDGNQLKEFYIRMLQQQLEHVFSKKEMQQFVLWQISEENKLIKSICQKREDEGERYLEWMKSAFENSHVNFRALNALLIGGIYYLALHSSINASTVCGISLNKKEDFQEVLRMIEVILDSMWPNGEEQLTAISNAI